MRERAFCPVCREGLPLRTRKAVAIVHDWQRNAEWNGPGEVVRRSRPCAATVHGRREIVQTLNIWEGAYEAPWAPFCGTQCAARFGLQAFRRVQNPALPAPMHETPCALSAAAPAGSDKPRSLSARYGLLLQEMSGSEAATLVRSAAAAKAARKHAPGTPGHPDWHPPGKPPPRAWRVPL
jgi:hypothetical protein